MEMTERRQLVVNARRADRLDALAAQIRTHGSEASPESVAQSAMLEPEDVAAAVVLACTQTPGSRLRVTAVTVVGVMSLPSPPAL
jgi:NADP-dependent 3-hydroxy acid dehydrogenase YdfG